jgi:hypothetical protein
MLILIMLMLMLLLKLKLMLMLLLRLILRHRRRLLDQDYSSNHRLPPQGHSSSLHLLPLGHSNNLHLPLLLGQCLRFEEGLREYIHHSTVHRQVSDGDYHHSDLAARDVWVLMLGLRMQECPRWEIPLVLVHQE